MSKENLLPQWHCEDWSDSPLTPHNRTQRPRFGSQFSTHSEHPWRRSLRTWWGGSRGERKGGREARARWHVSVASYSRSSHSWSGHAGMTHCSTWTWQSHRTLSRAPGPAPSPWGCAGGSNGPGFHAQLSWILSWSYWNWMGNAGPWEVPMHSVHV